VKALLVAAAILGLACGAPVEPNEAPAPAPSVWLDESSPLFAAQQAWGMPLPWEPEVVLDFGTREEIAVECGYPGAHPSACTQPSMGRILFATGETPERLAAAKEHELGHILAGSEHGHIVDPVGCPEPTGGPGDRQGDYIMCTYGKVVPGLTDADFTFVLDALTSALERVQK